MTLLDTTDLFERTHDLDVTPLVEAQSFVLTTHLEPDGDGIGSALALYRGLKELDKDVRIILEEAMPARYQFLDHDGVVEHINAGTMPAIREAEYMVVLDTNDIKRCGLPYEIRGESPVLVIDHHLGEVASNVLPICDPTSSSTGEIIYRMLTKMGVHVTSAIAEPIYASMLYDTRSFRFIRNRPETLEFAAALLRCGVDANRLQEEVFANRPQHLPRLYSRVFDRMKYELDGRLAWTVITREDLAELTLDAEAIREVISMIISLEKIEVALVLKEVSDDFYRISLRSKRAHDIFDIAARRGGGGHSHAAGATAKGHPEEIAKSVIEEVSKLFFRSQA
jgi:phosphoesterase RecJ-like protein